jgi:hypothetical protein
MAGIDYTIPGQIKPIQVDSPMNMMAQAMQLRALQDTAQMNALKFEEAQRDAQERNALAKLDPSSPQYLTQLKRVNPKLALDYQKSALEAESADITKKKNQADLFQAKIKESRYFLEGIDPNSPTAAQDYLNWHIANHKDSVLGPFLAARGADEVSARARIDEAIRTGKLPDLIMQSKLGMDRFTELTPAFNKAEREQIDQEHSDFLNTPGNPSLTRLQFIEFRKRQRGTATAPNAAAPAPAPAAAVDAAAPAPAPAAAVDLTNVPLANRSVMFNRPQDNQPAVNQLGGFRTNVAAVNNLGVMPAATTAADRPAPATTTQAAGTTERPAIAPNAARLMKSNLKSDQDAAAIIQRAYENDAKLTDKERDFAAAVDAGFKGNYVQYQDQLRETEAEREYRRAKEDGSFKGTFLEWKREMAKATKIVVQPAPGAKPTDTALDMLAYQYIKDSGTITQMPKQLRTAIVNRAAELMGGSAENMAGDITTNRQDTAAAKAAVKDFTSGKSAVATRSFNTAIDHLETMEKLATALQNNDTRVFNSIGNFFAKQTGTAAPANFEAAKAIVGGEVAKALTGANMALKDREEIRDAIIASSSPQQLMGVLKTFKQLLGGQLNSLNIQYQTSTGRDDFRNKLSPASKRELDALNPQAPARSSNAPRQMSPQDKAALDWANSNANDPRAAAIKKRLGVK